MIVANTGSVSLSYDGDRRAAYLLIDDSEPSIRRVEYDVDAEVKALSESNLPHADWIAKILESGCYTMHHDKRVREEARSAFGIAAYRSPANRGGKLCSCSWCSISKQCASQSYRTSTAMGFPINIY